VSNIKACLSAIYSELEGIVNWCHREFREFADNFARDMRSLRALWNWLYMSLYIYLCVWAALYYGKESLNTAIITTGGLVGTIFTAYIWSTTKERADIAKMNMPHIPVQKANEEEGEASD